MKRRSFLFATLLAAPSVFGHSPWGQYVVYRQKHLLIMSSKTDPNSYPYSEVLAEALNRAEPSSKARPARAKSLERCYNLFSTNQMQFMLLPRDATVQMMLGSGEFAGKPPLLMFTIYEFGDLVLSVHPEIESNIIRIVTHAVLEQLAYLPSAAKPEAMLKTSNLHVDSYTAIVTFLAS